MRAFGRGVCRRGRQLDEFEGTFAKWTGAPITFAEGENEVVFKVSSGVGGWAAALAVRDPGNELAFE